MNKPRRTPRREERTRRPLRPIGICLSGGGYRAAGFHLGTLDLLERLGLLDGVKMLSTVSGGTILGAAWAASKAQGEAYAVFRARFHGFLKTVNVMQEALQLFAQDRSKSLIQCAAEVYDRKLLAGKRFGDLPDPRAGAFFEELVFNATEFRSGVAFRFLRSASRRARFGNGHYHIPRSVADQVRLADAVAASSCFPGAFEPLWLPHDFQWPRDTPLAQVQARLALDAKPALPLMDGGIYENQGVESLQLADTHVGRRLGLLLISDTNQRKAELLSSQDQSPRGWVPLGLWGFLAGLLLLACLATVGVQGLGLLKYLQSVEKAPWSWGEGLVQVMALLLSGGVVALLSMAGLQLWKFRVYEHEGARFPVWQALRKLTVPRLLHLLRVRVASVLAMTSSVFMKRVRGLTLNSVAARYPRKLVFNVLYELDRQHPKLYSQAPWLEPSAELRHLARQAEAIGTKLWATPQELGLLIACGQATTCFNLLRFLLPRISRPVDPTSKESTQPGSGATVPADGVDRMAPPSMAAPSPLQTSELELFRQARALWEQFQKNPQAPLNRESP